MFIFILFFVVIVDDYLRDRRKNELKLKSVEIWEWTKEDYHIYLWNVQQKIAWFSVLPEGFISCLIKNMKTIENGNIGELRWESSSWIVSGLKKQKNIEQFKWSLPKGAKVSMKKLFIFCFENILNNSHLNDNRIE
jgi:hypothetical protein